MKGLIVLLLDNGIIKAEISSHGAELKSAIKNSREYMWCADPAYWGRTSPVLFPIVGGLKNKRYIFGDKEYHMGQHGFARDCDFELKASDDTSAVYILKSNENTKKKYPFDFELEIGYKLDGSSISVSWRVINIGTDKMYFSIGAHPAFNLKDGANYFIFDTDNPIKYKLLVENGLLDKYNEYSLENKGGAEIVKGMFDKDALIVEDNQAHEVALCDSNKQPYVKVSFDAPLFGLWSPAGKNAPFVCIEPWYGRCDGSDFDGTLEERDYCMMLEAGCEFYAEYKIELI